MLLFFRFCVPSLRVLESTFMIVKSIYAVYMLILFLERLVSLALRLLEDNTRLYFIKQSFFLPFRVINNISLFKKCLKVLNVAKSKVTCSQSIWKCYNVCPGCRGLAPESEEQASGAALPVPVNMICSHAALRRSHALADILSNLINQCSYSCILLIFSQLWHEF